jgi:hypothetical protein
MSTLTRRTNAGEKDNADETDEKDNADETDENDGERER